MKNIKPIFNAYNFMYIYLGSVSIFSECLWSSTFNNASAHFQNQDLCDDVISPYSYSNTFFLHWARKGTVLFTIESLFLIVEPVVSKLYFASMLRLKGRNFFFSSVSFLHSFILKFAFPLSTPHLFTNPLTAPFLTSFHGNCYLLIETERRGRNIHLVQILSFSYSPLIR